MAEVEHRRFFSFESINRALTPKKSSKKTPEPPALIVKPHLTEFMSPPVILETDNHNFNSVIEIDDQLLSMFGVGQKRTYYSDCDYQRLLENPSRVAKFQLTLHKSSFLNYTSVDRKNRPLFVFNLDTCPFSFGMDDQSFIQLAHFVFTRMDELVKSKYSVVIVDSKAIFPVTFIAKFFSYLPKKYFDNFHKLYVFFGITTQISVNVSLDISRLKIIKDVSDFYKDVAPVHSPVSKKVLLEHTTNPTKFFGNSLQNIEKINFKNYSTLPVVIEAVIQFFSGKPELLSTEGLFRIGANTSEVKRWCSLFDDWRVYEFPQSEDPHVVANVLKEFLFSLNAPVLPNETAEKVFSIFGKNDNFSDTSNPINHTRDIIGGMCEPNKKVLNSLVNLANILLTASQRKGITAGNISTIFGQTIYPMQSLGPGAIHKVTTINTFFAFLMQNYLDVWKE
ncbi:Rho GTPase-activating protein, putative [Entamoeba invadens IP1]|uniref:Rho GTPase-activating protein, putative n=1 Tax=Entamoeba invadens IP1 TaxID=370355 RepID=UPI0002C3FA5B|nr:Rho GTPase-activating protein, putative [Entamoeba invadens IP1]ELP94013.1 Rho GTPase-activating protein, putative [Entamoeba invadens IP1]|eukprot:XP_004260784.1 Rho GTPase-activating protein, putative [Entamoeba invadens IP1]